MAAVNLSFAWSWKRLQQSKYNISLWFQEISYTNIENKNVKKFVKLRKLNESEMYFKIFNLRFIPTKWPSSKH